MYTFGTSLISMNDYNIIIKKYEIQREELNLIATLYWTSLGPNKDNEINTNGIL